MQTTRGLVSHIRLITQYSFIVNRNSFIKLIVKSLRFCRISGQYRILLYSRVYTCAYWILAFRAADTSQRAYNAVIKRYTFYRGLRVRNTLPRVTRTIGFYKLASARFENYREFILFHSALEARVPYK